MRVITIALDTDAAMSAQLAALLVAGDELVAMIGYVDRIVFAVRNGATALRADPTHPGVSFPKPIIGLPPIVTTTIE